MMRTWRGSNSGDEALATRVEALEDELRDVRREAAELRAAHDAAIDLALISAVPNGVFRLVLDARSNGWRVTYRRNPRREDYGTIAFEHPDGSAHNCSIDLPLPDDPLAQRRIETEIRMRIGWPHAA
jgi:hypothetical protein